MIALLLSLCLSSPPQDGGYEPPPVPELVPTPRLVDGRFAPFVLPDTLRVVASEPELGPLAAVLATHLSRVLGRPVPVGEAPAHGGDILLTMGYLPEEYRGQAEACSIEVFEDHAALSGSSPAGVARSASRLLQLLQHDPESATWMLPPVHMVDAPAFDWRGISLDLARFPHPVEAIEETIELAFLFSLNTVHLHLDDDQAFTFPASILPARTDPGQAGADRGYSKEQLAHLVRFADARGITLMPEIDLPAHSSALVRARPDLFGSVDEEGKARSTHVVNMASERAYVALEGLLAEVAEVFWNSPYLHLGGDEVWAPQLLETPEFAPFAAEHAIPTSVGEGAVQAMLNHFLVRVTGMARDLGKRPVLWEGFAPPKDPSRAIGKDVWVMSWNQSSQTPEALLEAGYTVLNCGWEPMYVVPAQGWASQPARAYDWRPRRVQQRWGGRSVELDGEAAMPGAQICVWEQRPESLVPSLLRILPEVSERMWASGNAPATWSEFQPRAAAVGALAKKVLRPVQLRWEGTHTPHGVAFQEEVQVRLESKLDGILRYVVGPSFDVPVTAASEAYGGKALELKESAVVSAALFGADGQQIGGTTRVRFEQGPMLWDAEVFGLAPARGIDWEQAFSGPRIGSGYLLDPSPARIAAINREQFAKVRPDHHVDTRVLAWSEVSPEARIEASRPRVWGRHALRLRGQLRIPEAGDWQVTMGTRGSAARLSLGGLRILDCGAEAKTVTGRLEAGVYALELDYAMLDVHDDLQLSLGLSGAEAQALVKLALPIGARVEAAELRSLESF